MAKKTAPKTVRRKAAPKRTPARGAKISFARLAVAVEKRLLDHARQYAREHDTTLAAMVEEGLRRVTGMNKAPVLPPGDVEAQAGSPSTEFVGWEQLAAWMEEQQATLTQIRDALGDVAASLPTGLEANAPRTAKGPRIPPL
jgi:hypothetical protein